jgi:hypothetical protein
MADLKISALPAATTPVGGTEVLPIVQSSTTKKVSIDNLTKGRVVNALTFDTDVAAAGVTLTGTTLAADGTDANIDISITPKGTGEVNLTKVDIDAGAIDGTTIGAGSASTGDFTTLTSSSGATLNGGVVINEPGADVDFRVEGDTDANLLFVDASTDRIGLSTSTPATKLDVNGVITGGNGTIKTVISYTTEGVVGTLSNNALVFYANNAERARIHAGGGMTVGGTTEDGVLTSIQPGETSVQLSLRDNTNTRRAFFLGSGYYGYQWAQGIYSNGGKAFLFANVSGTEVGSIVINSGGVAYNTTSDYRLKDNPQSLTGSGAFIDGIKPKTWVWKADGTKGVGFIAHELAEVAPLSVSGEKDAVRVDLVKDENGQYVEKEIPSYQSVDYGSAEIVANLVAEIQLLRARVAQLESK